MSSWIYRVLAAGEPRFAKFLHEAGYGTRNKYFKFFSFSNLNIPRRFIDGDRIHILSPDISFSINLLEHRIASCFIKGMLLDTAPFSLGDKKSKCHFLVSSIEENPFSIPSNEVIYLRTISPIFVTKPKIKPNGKLGKDFLSPSNPDYWEKLTNNLWNKYYAARSEGLVNSVDAGSNIQFDLSPKEPRKKGVRIKAFSPGETHNIGYLFDFKLTAPPELIRLGMLAGFGEANAQGFGAVGIFSSQINRYQNEISAY